MNRLIEKYSDTEELSIFILSELNEINIMRKNIKNLYFYQIMKYLKWTAKYLDKNKKYGKEFNFIHSTNKLKWILN